MSTPDLLPLEFGMVHRAVRNAVLKERLLSFKPTPGASKSVDLILLAAATALLGEGAEQSAASLALEILNDRPQRGELRQLAYSVEASWEDVCAAVNNYVMWAGYSPSPIGAFNIICDTYLGRVVGGATHPIVGVASVSYYSNTAHLYPEAKTVVSCQQIWSSWLENPAKPDEFERMAHALSRQWVKNSPHLQQRQKDEWS